MLKAIIRYLVSFIAAFTIVFGLFWLMQFLIATSNPGMKKQVNGALLDFVRVPKDETVVHKTPKPEKPPAPEEPPPTPPPPSMDHATPNATSVAVSDVKVNTNINLSASGFGLQSADGEYLPIVKVQPIYPQSALARGIEGYVIVEFTVTKQGTTKNIHVVESKPKGIFDRAAMQAAAKFKYKPRVVDGHPVEVSGVQNLIKFVISNN